METENDGSIVLTQDNAKELALKVRQAFGPYLVQLFHGGAEVANRVNLVRADLETVQGARVFTIEVSGCGPLNLATDGSVKFFFTPTHILVCTGDGPNIRMRFVEVDS